MKKHIFLLTMILFLGLIGFTNGTGYAAGEVSLYTPYTHISVTPGDSIHYSIDIINNTATIQTADLSVRGLHEDWEYQLRSGGWSIEQISVRPDDSQTISLDVEVPLQVDKGTYSFEVVAEGMDTLPLTIEVTEQGTYQTELSTDQPNMEGHADSTFRFEATIKNRTAAEQLYALSAEAPRGWDVQFLSGGQSVTSVKVAPNEDEKVDVKITPPPRINAGSYKIPVTASSNSTSAEATFEVVITGRYAIQFSTVTETLSTDITAGKEQTVTFRVENTGSADLRDIKLRADTPMNWDVTFEPGQITRLEPGKTAEVKGTIKADQDAIAGDYMVYIYAETPETSFDVPLRVSVKTSLLWGWIGVLIIAAVIAGIYYLFRVYGRR